MAPLVVLVLFSASCALHLEGGCQMDPATSQALITAAGVFGAAVLAYLAAWVRSNTLRLNGHDAQLAARTPTAGPRPPRASDLVGGAGGPRPAPLWNQLADPLPDGTLPPQRWNECGEECCAMEISRQHGVPLSADALRALLGGPRRSALTSAQDLVRCLALCNVPAEAEVDSPIDVAERLQAITARGGVAICLGTWVAPGILHWILVTRADHAGCGANDPWMGRRRVWTWVEFRAAYAGELVRSTRQPDAGA